MLVQGTKQANGEMDTQTPGGDPCFPCFKKSFPLKVKLLDLLIQLPKANQPVDLLVFKVFKHIYIYNDSLRGEAGNPSTGDLWLSNFLAARSRECPSLGFGDEPFGVSVTGSHKGGLKSPGSMSHPAQWCPFSNFFLGIGFPLKSTNPKKEAFLFVHGHWAFEYMSSWPQRAISFYVAQAGQVSVLFVFAPSLVMAEVFTGRVPHFPLSVVLNIAFSWEPCWLLDVVELHLAP